MKVRAEGNLRLFDAGAMAETGFANGRGTVMLGGRYSYTAAVVSLLAKDIKLDYRDFQARVTYDLTPHDRVTAFSFGSYDLLGQRQTGGLNVLFGTEFYRLSLSHEHSFDSGAVRTDVMLGYDETRLPAQRNARDRSIGLRSQMHCKLSDKLVLRAGIDAALDGYTGTPKNPQLRGLIAPLRSNSPERNPAFYRIDLRLEKRWQLGKTAWVSVVAEMLNVTLNKETFGGQQIGPIAAPSIGVEGGF